MTATSPMLQSNSDVVCIVAGVCRGEGAYSVEHGWDDAKAPLGNTTCSNEFVVGLLRYLGVCEASILRLSRRPAWLGARAQGRRRRDSAVSLNSLAEEAELPTKEVWAGSSPVASRSSFFATRERLVCPRSPQKRRVRRLRRGNHPRCFRSSEPLHHLHHRVNRSRRRPRCRFRPLQRVEAAPIAPLNAGFVHQRVAASWLDFCPCWCEWHPIPRQTPP